MSCCVGWFVFGAGKFLLKVLVGVLSVCKGSRMFYFIGVLSTSLCCCLCSREARSKRRRSSS